MDPRQQRRYLREQRWRQVGNLGNERWRSSDTAQIRTLAGATAEQIFVSLSEEQWRP
jgi:hypothetical protein